MRSSLSQPGSISTAQLRTQLSGRMIPPDDPAYDQARTIFYGGFDHRPQLIVQVADHHDVARVVTWPARPAWSWRSAAAATAPAGHSAGPSRH